MNSTTAAQPSASVRTSANSRIARRLGKAWLFLLPNFAGFLLFTAGPIVFSLWMAFTNWSLVKHNQYSTQPIQFIGLENFRRLLWGDESRLFWESMGNTVYLMIGIPVGIAGSLAVALMLNRPIGPTQHSTRLKSSLAALILGIVAALGTFIATWPGSTPSAPSPSQQVSAIAAPSNDLLTPSRQTDVSASSQSTLQFELAQRRSKAAAAAMLILGIVIALGLGTGVVFFRTLFYLPSLLSGIALFLLWKSLYKPTGGAVNVLLEPLFQSLQSTVSATPPWLWYGGGLLLWIVTLSLLLRFSARAIRHWRDDGAGSIARGMSAVLTLACLGAVGAGVGYWLCQLPEHSFFATGYAPLDERDLAAIRSELLSSGAAWFTDIDRLQSELDVLGANHVDPDLMIETASSLLSRDGASQHAGELRHLIRSRAAIEHIGYTAGAGLHPPNWLVDAAWAKPALIIMGVWMAVGGANMLLYLAGLSNIPEDLYEAASLDGAGRWPVFCNVTWPQLAPTTFFIVIMSAIGGLQGGFDQARAMTNGKYGTEVVTYYLYNLAFTDQFQLGLASAVAWIMFAVIFVMTVINYRFGSTLVND